MSKSNPVSLRDLTDDLRKVESCIWHVLPQPEQEKFSRVWQGEGELLESSFASACGFKAVKVEEQT